MKKIILAALLTVFSLTLCFSQDVIIKKSGEEIQVNILEVGQTEIKYKMFNNEEGPTFAILKSEVFMIKYANGTKDVFNEENKDENTSPLLARKDLFIQGHKDALRCYKGYKVAGSVTLVTSLLSPLVGLIPAIACSVTEPKEINLNAPNPDLIKKTEYYNGYAQRSKKIKQRKVWTNWGIGFAANIVIVLLLTSQ